MTAKQTHFTSEHISYYYKNNLLVSCSYLYFRSNLFHQLYVCFAMYIFLFALFLLVTAGNDDLVVFNIDALQHLLI